MNAMLVTSGHPWRIITVEERQSYMAALEKQAFMAISPTLHKSSAHSKRYHSSRQILVSDRILPPKILVSGRILPPKILVLGSIWAK